MPSVCPNPSGVCIVCGINPGGWAGRARFCSARCQTEYVRYPEGRIRGRDCVLCGVWIDFSAVRPGGRRVKSDTFKCFTCRRDQRYPVTAQQLADRDGTSCSICSKPIDMALKWPNRWAPTRDHIIPWTLGGSNEPENFALAHFRCNIQKRNKLGYVHDEAA